ncbi:protein O-mannosyl-transferase family [Candidatus Leptofilum sp.]|uniref:protein O-mannosyl-transferase family n=1 Tax=Candidatus Leptofilum sp. TaxID=3241576 RepID=UPI003B590574
MWPKRLEKVLALLAPLSLGSFAGRLLSEQWAIHYAVNSVAASWGIAIGLTAMLSGLALFSLRRHTINQTWPLLLLLGYVFYPYPDFRIVALVVLLVTAVLLQILPVPAQIVAPAHRLKVGLVGTCLIFGLLYFFTLAPGLLPADNGEFQLIGTTLGMAHPPGFPLYTLLSKLMTWLPIAASAAYKINLLSLLTSTATLGLVYLIVFDLTQKQFAAGTAVLALGTATTFWAQATTANIRSLTALFAALAIFALIHHQRQKANTDRYLVLFAAALSFGFTHHLSLAFMGLVFCVSLLLIDPAFLRTPSRWKRPLLAALAGLLPLLYLPLRAGADVPGASDGLNTLSGFLNHFLALGFQGDFFYFIEPVVLWPRLQVMGNVLTFQFSPWLLAGAVLGLIWLLRRDWRLGLLLGGSFALHTLVTATYRAPQTVEYMLPAYLPVAICVGLASGYLRELVAQRPNSWREVLLVATAVLLTAAIFQGWQRWPSFRWLHTNEDAHDYAQTILDGAPPDSLILANWHWATPLWYLQTVEGQRPDVEIEYVAPGEDPYSQTWLQRIEEGLGNGRNVITTYIDEAAYSTLRPAEPLGEALLFRQTPRTELPANFTTLGATLNENIEIAGYHIELPTVEIGQETTITVAWQTSNPSVQFYLHLRDNNQNIVAQDDVTVRSQLGGLTLTRFRLTPRSREGLHILHLGSDLETVELGEVVVVPTALPPATNHPIHRPVIRGDYNLTLVGYDWDTTLLGQPRLYYHWQSSVGYISTVADEPNLQTMSEIVMPWGIPQPYWIVPPPQPDDHYVPLGQGIVWTGGSLSDLQTAVSPDQQFAMPIQFINGRPLLRDYVISTRLVGYEEDNFTWAWCDLVDGVPAMGGIPTLKWIGGSQVQSPRTIIFPPHTEPANFTDFCQSEKPAPGAPILYVDNRATDSQTVGGLLILYDAFTNRPLPILDERITAVTSWIPFGEITITDE